MKLFGEFLVSQNVITEDSLANALIEQIRQTPSFAEIAWKEKLLTAPQILDLLKFQSQRRIGFLEAMKEAKSWTQDLENQLYARASEIRIPLGQILIQMGASTSQAITSALDEFLGQVEPRNFEPPTQSPVQETSTSSVPSISAESESPVAIESVAPGSLFLESFTESLKASFDTFWASLSFESEVTQMSIRDQFDQVHRLRGIARFENLAGIEKALEPMEDFLAKLATKEPPPVPAIKALHDVFGRWLDALWMIRTRLSEGVSTEVSVLEIKDLESILQDVEKMSHSLDAAA